MRMTVYDPPCEGFPYLAVAFYDDDAVAMTVACSTHQEAEEATKELAEQMAEAGAISN